MSSKQQTESSRSPPLQQAETPPPSLNTKNYINVLAFIFNLVFTYGIGTMGWFGNGTNSELSDKYQTLVTPDSFAFVIWAVIFLFQAVFVLVQLLRRYRATPVVQQGVGYWYALACIFQVGWTFAFAYEVIWLSVIMIFSIWFSLVGILYSQYYIYLEDTNKTANWISKLVDFWLFRFPFSIHCGWLTAASLLNCNVLAVDLEAPSDVQLAVGIISLAILHAVGVWVTFGLRARPNFTVVGVLSWANYFIHVELKENPKESITERFSQDTIDGVSLAAAAVAVILLIQIAVRLAMMVYARFMTKASSGEETENLVTAQEEGNNNKDGDLGSMTSGEERVSVEEQV